MSGPLSECFEKLLSGYQKMSYALFNLRKLLPRLEMRWMISIARLKTPVPLSHWNPGHLHSGVCMWMISKKTMMCEHLAVPGMSWLLVEPDSVAQQRVTSSASSVVSSRELACLSWSSETNSSDVDARSCSNEIDFMGYGIGR